MDKRRLYEHGEARSLLGNIGRTKFFEEIKAGRLRTVKIGRRCLIADEDLESYVQLLRSESADAQDEKGA
jgi:excisionase family DNA binding protein